jgi:hypothetical protein
MFVNHLSGLGCTLRIGLRGRTSVDRYGSEDHVGRVVPAVRADRAWRGQMYPQGLSRLQAAAQAKGGECLDEVYQGVSARYRFRCKAGHVWKTMGAKIVEGFWCPECNVERQRLGIEAMQAMARERGGRCLSEQYVNTRQRLQWECGHGHVWWTAAQGVRRGSWCPSCAILDRIRTRGQRKRLRYERAPGFD